MHCRIHLLYTFCPKHCTSEWRRREPAVDCSTRTKRQTLLLLLWLKLLECYSQSQLRNAEWWVQWFQGFQSFQRTLWSAVMKQWQLLGVRRQLRWRRLEVNLQFQYCWCDCWRLHEQSCCWAGAQSLWVGWYQLIWCCQSLFHLFHLYSGYNQQLYFLPVRENDNLQSRRDVISSAICSSSICSSGFRYVSLKISFLWFSKQFKKLNNKQCYVFPATMSLVLIKTRHCNCKLKNILLFWVVHLLQ